jgi:hypothetical protein
METNKETILDALYKHIAQRSGIDALNYFDDYRDTEGRKAFAAEYREILREGREARMLLHAVRSRDISADEILAASKRAFSGRLSWNPDKAQWDYCTGQYFPTEYRAAACAVLAAALWRYMADDGADVRRWAKDNFGRGVQSRWFN